MNRKKRQMFHRLGCRKLKFLKWDFDAGSQAFNYWKQRLSAMRSIKTNSFFLPSLDFWAFHASIETEFLRSRWEECARYSPWMLSFKIEHSEHYMHSMIFWTVGSFTQASKRKQSIQSCSAVLTPPIDVSMEEVNSVVTGKVELEMRVTSILTAIFVFSESQVSDAGKKLTSFLQNLCY